MGFWRGCLVVIGAVFAMAVVASFSGLGFEWMSVQAYLGTSDPLPHQMRGAGVAWALTVGTGLIGFSFLLDAIIARLRPKKPQAPLRRLERPE